MYRGGTSKVEYMSVYLLIDYSSKSHYSLIETKYRYNVSKINILTITAKIFIYEIYKVSKEEDWDSWHDYHIICLFVVLNRQLYFKYKDDDSSSISPATRPFIHTTYWDYTPDTREDDSCSSTAKIDSSRESSSIFSHANKRE